MSIAKSFRDLNVYNLAREEARAVFEFSKCFPKDERYSLTDQIRRSSRAVNAMIAEAWGRRLYKAAFINKINEALSESMETQAWLDHALDSHYITPDQFEELDARSQSIGAMLSRMIDRADDFCKYPPTKDKTKN